MDINPFAALFGLFGKRKDAKKDSDVVLDVEKIKKDNFIERTMRASAIDDAASTLYTLYDIYKKAHGMASAPGVGFENYDEDAADDLSQGGDVGLKDVFKKRGD